MSETKHTPGPWIIQHEMDNEGIYIYEDESENEICRIPNTNEVEKWGNLMIEDPETRVANARLIAAAPELLNALQDIKCLLQELGEDNSPQSKDALAIALNTLDTLNH